jgi:hypothetical protein
MIIELYLDANKLGFLGNIDGKEKAASREQASWYIYNTSILY